MNLMRIKYYMLYNRISKKQLFYRKYTYNIIFLAFKINFPYFKI
jgi:hypothetical protein